MNITISFNTKPITVLTLVKACGLLSSNSSGNRGELQQEHGNTAQTFREFSEKNDSGL